MLTEISSLDEYRALGSEIMFSFRIIFKHSTSCSLSANAFKEFKAFLDNKDLDAFLVIVQNSRDVSDKIEEDFGVKHESPQVLFLVDGQAVFSLSHRDIHLKNLKKAYNEYF